MENPFSTLEIQLLRASLGTKSDEQIAELLERPVTEIVAMIDELTGGLDAERTRDVTLYLAEQAKAKERKKIRPAKMKAPGKKKITDVVLDACRAERTKARIKAERDWEANREKTRRRESERTYKTRQIDYSKLITVRLDDKTHAMIEPQATLQATHELIKKTKANYELNKALNKYKISGDN